MILAIPYENVGVAVPVMGVLPMSTLPPPVTGPVMVLVVLAVTSRTWLFKKEPGTLSTYREPTGGADNASGENVSVAVSPTAVYVKLVSVSTPPTEPVEA